MSFAENMESLGDARIGIGYGLGFILAVIGGVVLVYCLRAARAADMGTEKKPLYGESGL